MRIWAAWILRSYKLPAPEGLFFLPAISADVTRPMKTSLLWLKQPGLMGNIDIFDGTGNEQKTKHDNCIREKDP